MEIQSLILGGMYIILHSTHTHTHTHTTSTKTNI